MGPGVFVMVADNDAGGIYVYAQAGQAHGMAIVWLLIFLAPVLYVVQEMVARLGAVTGAGHARLIFERFGRRWGYFALSDLLVLNILTIVTEFIGVALALGYFGVSRYVSVPVAAVALIAVTGLGSFRRWEIAMYGMVGLSLIAVPLAALSGAQHIPALGLGTGVGTTASGGGLLFLVVAMIGTTVAPWQLFFQQSNVVDKRITARWLGFERVDLLIGAVIFTIGAVAVLFTSAAVLGNTGWSFADAGQVASALRDRAGWTVGALFAVVLLDGSVLGAAAVTLANSYAIGDVFGTKHSLHRRWHDATTFYGSFALSLVLGATIVLMPRAPLGLVTIGVQALAGVLLPSATVFLLLLCNDPVLLGPRTNPRWLNLVAAAVVGGLVEMSALLTVTILFPNLDIGVVAIPLTALLAAMVVVIWHMSRGRVRSPAFMETPSEILTWTMPPIDTLPLARPSRARSAGLVLLRIYLLGAALLVTARIVQTVFGA